MVQCSCLQRPWQWTLTTTPLSSLLRETRVSLPAISDLDEPSSMRTHLQHHLALTSSATDSRSADLWISDGPTLYPLRTFAITSTALAWLNTAATSRLFSKSNDTPSSRPTHGQPVYLIPNVRCLGFEHFIPSPLSITHPPRLCPHPHANTAYRTPSLTDTPTDKALTCSLLAGSLLRPYPCPPPRSPSLWISPSAPRSACACRADLPPYLPKALDNLQLARENAQPAAHKRAMYMLPASDTSRAGAIPNNV
ncbi:hypothetical protein C8Q80DRAFT_442376 [Daedaleopsis nitida]|nr:hypothetical protein C8Q80DRAFT_442376 [Daedaleopsis nitida]